MKPDLPLTLRQASLRKSMIMHTVAPKYNLFSCHPQFLVSQPQFLVSPPPICGLAIPVTKEMGAETKEMGAETKDCTLGPPYMHILFAAGSAFLLYPSMILLGLGGYYFLMTNMQLGNILPTKRSTIISLYCGAYDSSAFLLLLIKVSCNVS